MTGGPARRIVISGGNGVVGAGLIGELLARLDPAIEIVCLLRSEQSRLDFLSRFGETRIQTLLCDLSHADSATAAAASLRHAQEAVGVHCAADVAWDKRLDEVLGINVLGSLNFARILTSTSSRLQLVYVSSAYTALEDWTYRNAYEESKASGERELRKAFPGLPIAAFSCSLVIGRRKDGAIHRFHGLYPFIKLMACMGPPFVVGNKACLIDLVPADWVSQELASLVERGLRHTLGEPVVAAAGARRIPVAAMLATIEDRINSFRARYGLPPRPPVTIMPARRWSFLSRSLEKWRPPGLSMRDFRYFDRLLQIYRPYTESDAVQPPRNVVEEAPAPETFLGISVDYWLKAHSDMVLRRMREDKAPWSQMLQNRTAVQPS
jgi:nucleoside-diphosphate-sugar epimerase